MREQVPLSETEITSRSRHMVSLIHEIESEDNKNPGFRIMYDLSRVLDFPLEFPIMFMSLAEIMI